MKIKSSIIVTEHFILIVPAPVPMHIPLQTLTAERDKFLYNSDHERVGKDMRFDMVYICPIHTIQVANPKRKVRHWHIECEIVPHHKLIMKRTEPYDPVLATLCQEIIRFSLMYREEHASKRHLRLITERKREVLDFEVMDCHDRQVQIEVSFAGNRVVAITRIIDKTTRKACGSTGQDFQSRQHLQKTIMIPQAVIQESGIFACHPCGVAGRTELHVYQLLAGDVIVC